MASIHFIVNPLRPSIGLRWPYEEKRIEAITQDFEVHITRGRLHAEILARKAVEDGAKLIVCVGGDSTLSEIVNGLSRAAAGGRDLPLLALYPQLQQGDFVRCLPQRDSIENLLHAYFEGTAIQEPIDLGEIQFSGEYGQKIRRNFINSAGFGFSSLVTGRLSGDHSIARSKLGVLRLILRLLPFYRSPRLEIGVDDQKVAIHDVFTGVIQNGRYGSHGLLTSSKAQISDGLLDVTLLLKTFRIKYLFVLLPYVGEKTKHATFAKKISCQRLVVKPPAHLKRIRVDFDGDVWGYLPAEFSVREKALLVIR